MDMHTIATQGLVLLGCGKMGSAMLQGWLAQGLPERSVWILDPFPSDFVNSLGAAHVNAGVPDAPGMVVIAVKPQMMTEALPDLAPVGGGGVPFLSVAAGTPIAHYEKVLGSGTPVIRAMPNTPAAVGKGITALVANGAGQAFLDLAEDLVGAVGQTVRLESEDQMDAVTAVSGSGPAYVFHLIETLASAGEAEGLPPDLAMALAKATVAGAGALAEGADETPEQLRINVTSPKGTTEAALKVLMDDTDGFPTLLRRAVRAAADRSRELGQ